MNVGLSLARPWIWLLRKTISLWVRTTVRPPDIAQRLSDRDRPKCYVLEQESLADLLVLQDTCVNLGLPRPSRRLVIGSVSERRSVCYLERSAGFFGTRIDLRPPELLANLVSAAGADPTLDLDIVPVAIYWGRAPQKEGSSLRLLLAENWVFAGRFRRFLMVIFNGRSTLVEFGESHALRDFILAGARARACREAHLTRVALAIAFAARGGNRSGSVPSAHHRQSRARDARGAGCGRAGDA